MVGSCWQICRQRLAKLAAFSAFDVPFRFVSRLRPWTAFPTIVAASVVLARRRSS
ncbi:hypothetical protein PLANPX_1783 [Lacipirellula parvula]|uniref:Uncharacterized protein n=1 Tax=Lacipirellula parvula TaxID=2650471 RepID=A0A5K7XBE8_9BACT|nr:hypothetical protein PLANPX_1783 [Lacipirellula parvula]